MTERWYRAAASHEPLTQGDFVLECPALAWNLEAFTEPDAPLPEQLGLERFLDAVQLDLIVMTQACDLEHHKVESVVLCPHYGLSEYRANWEESLRSKGQNPTAKAWRRFCDDICEGSIWNLSLLDAFRTDGLDLEHRVVDFHEVVTLPRRFLEALLRSRGGPRAHCCPRTGSTSRRH